MTETAIRVASSVEDLLAGATDVRPMKTGDSLSGCRFEHLYLDGEPHVVKYLCVDDDWIMRASGDIHCRQGLLWRSELPSRLPSVIDHTVVGLAGYRTPTGRDGVALLMRDVGGYFVAEGSSSLPDEQHLHFIDHMAELHASLWGWHDDIELMSFGLMYTMLTPVTSAVEAGLAGTASVPPALAPGWARLRTAAPRAADIIMPLLADPGPLIEGLMQTPSSFLHGDWKLGNLGSHPDGRTILVDWDRSCEGPPCFELAWYLAVNCDRMAMSKEAAIDAYRASLERRGIDTGSWWQTQLALSLLGGLLMLGWSKTGGDPQEIGWWEDRTLEAARYLP